MLTATPVVFSLIVAILSCLCNASDQNCLRDGTEQNAMQEQDGDLVSFLQAGSSPHLTINAGVGGRKHPTDSVARQSEFKAPLIASPPIKEKQNISTAHLSTHLPNMTSLTELAGHCARFAKRFFNSGSEWVLPVIVVIITLLGVAIYLCEFRNRNSDAKLQSKAITQNVVPTVPVDAGWMVASEFKSKDAVEWIEQRKQSYAGPTQSVQQLQPPPTDVCLTPKAPPQSVSRDYRQQHRSMADLQPLSRPDDDVLPLCPSLALPVITSESRFAVNLKELQAAKNDSELKVCGINGKPVLNLKINEDPKSGTRLDIYLERSEEREPCCSIIAPQDHESHFEIRGPKDKHYGIFDSSKKNLNEVYYKRAKEGAYSPIMRIEGNSSLMRFWITTQLPKCNPVAVACVNDKDYKSEPHFEIRALPANFEVRSDAMLVIAVVMGIALFTEDETMIVDDDGQQGGTGSL